MTKNKNIITGCRLSAFVLSLFLFGALKGFAQADSLNMNPETKAQKPWPVSKFTARLGTFWAINTTELGAGVNGRDYSTFSFEDDLDMNRNTYSVLFNFTSRFGRHHRVDFSYYNIYRSTGTSLKKDIHFGEHTYPVNSEIGAHLNTNILRLSYGYSFVSNHKLEIGALIGFHVMAFNIGFDLDGETRDLSYKDDVKFTAPLPDLGIFGTYVLNNRWALSAELGYFYVQYKDLTGRILSPSLYAQYKISNHWEADLGYTGFDVRVDLDRQRLDADFNWAYSGPFVNIAYKFGK